MIRILPGHIIVRRDGRKFFVGKTHHGIFLFSMEDGNRWMDSPIDPSIRGTTTEVIEALGREFRGFTIEGRNCCDIKLKTEDTCNQSPCCNDLKECEYKDVPEVTERDIRLIVSDTLVHLNPNGSMGQMADKLARNVFEYLAEDDK